MSYESQIITSDRRTWVLCHLSHCRILCTSIHCKSTDLSNQIPTKATLNQPYHANIYIGGGYVCDLSTLISTDDILVLPQIYETRHQTHTIDNTIPTTDYSKLTVTGTPTSTKPIKIKLSGFTCGTMFTGTDIDKEYTIEVIK